MVAGPAKGEGGEDEGVAAPRGLQVFRRAMGDLEVAVFAFRVPEPKIPATLSGAEQEIARLLCQGVSRAEIARVRQRSAATVDNQVKSLYAKMGVSSRATLASALMRPL